MEKSIEQLCGRAIESLCSKTRSPIPFIITIGIAMAVTGYSRVM